LRTGQITINIAKGKALAVFFNLSNPDILHGQLLVGLVPSLANIAVHAATMTLLSWTAHRTLRAVEAAWPWARLALVMMAAVTVLMMAHLMEIIIWGLTYAAVGAVPNDSESFYFAFVNYTTLGYGDIIPVKRWRLLGPMAAMNGVLLFGWSTAVIYDLLRTVTQVIPLRPNSG
jgi:hypothetical protein